MSNQTEWNRVFGGEQEGADAWSDIFRQHFSGSKSPAKDGGVENVEFSNSTTHQVQLSYFKRSGKWYADGSFETQLDSMWRIVEDVRSRQSRGESLPGIAGSGKGFIILVDSETHPNAYPHLITPE